MKTAIITTLVLMIMLSFTFNNTDAQDPTEEANSIRERVKEKVETVRKNPKAYVGSVTNKTEDTLQIQNDIGEIQLISIEPETVSFAKIDKKTTSADYDDIGIGDYIIAMGFANGNGVLEAKRIVITSKPEPSTIKAIVGNVGELDDKQVTINTKEKEYTLAFPKRWKGPEIEELKKGMELIAIGNIEGDTISIRTIQQTSEIKSASSTN